MSCASDADGAVGDLSLSESVLKHSVGALACPVLTESIRARVLKSSKGFFGRLLGGPHRELTTGIECTVAGAKPHTATLSLNTKTDIDGTGDREVSLARIVDPLRDSEFLHRFPD